jgi:hypothetical protein
MPNGSIATMESVDGDAVSVSSEIDLSRQYGTPTAGQLEKINTLSKRALSSDEVFSFRTKMIGDRLIEDRYIKLHKSLLDIYKVDAQKGVSFMLDHPWAGVFSRPKAAYSYGRTYDALTKKGDIDGEAWAVHGDVYIVRGKEKDGIKTDQIIADIEDGTLFDVSIGFGFSTSECSICGKNIRECEHWPGATYNINGEEKLCYVVGKPPGYLMELSGVFDGAYDSAGILSNGGEIETSEYASIREKDFKKDIPKKCIYSLAKDRLVVLAKKNDLVNKSAISMYTREGGDDKMNEKTLEMLETFGITLKEGETNFEDVLTQVAEKWDKSTKTIELVEAKLDQTEDFMPKEKAIEVLGKEYSADQILLFAKEGMAYRKELVDDAIEWGVRAQGNEFSKDSWEQMLSEPGRTIQAIKDFRDGFKKQAEEEIPAGKRTSFKSNDGSGKKDAIPDDYYKI